MPACGRFGPEGDFKSRKQPSFRASGRLPQHPKSVVDLLAPRLLHIRQLPCFAHSGASAKKTRIRIPMVKAQTISFGLGWKMPIPRQLFAEQEFDRQTRVE